MEQGCFMLGSLIHCILIVYLVEGTVSSLLSNVALPCGDTLKFKLNIPEKHLEIMYNHPNNVINFLLYTMK